MMVEYERVRQEKDGYRRLFYDDQFDLYIWYPRKGGEISGFQLIYTSGSDKKALTWTAAHGFSHAGIDEGEDRLVNRSPVLVQDGLFEYESVLARLSDRIQPVERTIRDFVISRIRQYHD